MIVPACSNVDRSDDIFSINQEIRVSLVSTNGWLRLNRLFAMLRPALVTLYFSAGAGGLTCRWLVSMLHDAV